MNVITAFLKNTGRIMVLLAATVSGYALSSCNSIIYDDEGECSVTYRVKFRYDLNMKWADAFVHEVKSVHLYAFDNNGTLVWQNAEKGDALTAEGYAMTLALPAGDYHLVAWCGLENEGERKESFSVPAVQTGETRLEELCCMLNRQHEASGAYSQELLYPLFHGMLDVSLPANDDGGEYTYTIPLTKDTNHIRIILQHLSGEPVDEKDFTFRIEEKNGLMGYDNTLLADEMITYRAYNTRSGTAGLGIEDYPEAGSRPNVKTLRTKTQTSVSVAIADLSIARLTKGRKTYLTVEKAEDGSTVARIPLTDYALLLKDGYGYDMTDQEYLDREDEYSLTFFLDQNRSWIGTSIIINSWKLVLDDIDFE